jgi:NDP-sugar pyrophosphorylase family protein
MKAFIFAAGLGTRLKPLTDDRPKALVNLCGKPLIWHTINYLKKFDVNEIVVNVHHHAPMLIDYLIHTNWSIPVSISDESDFLLDTGGGLLKARPLLENKESFIAINVDIVSSFNLADAIEFHKKNKPLVTLVVRDRVTSRKFLFDENWQLSGWKNFESGKEIFSSKTKSNLIPLAFSGIHIISPHIFNLINETGKFSIVDLYLRLSKNNSISGYQDTSDFWLDLGKPGQIALAEQYLIKNNF